MVLSDGIQHIAIFTVVQWSLPYLYHWSLHVFEYTAGVHKWQQVQHFQDFYSDTKKHGQGCVTATQLRSWLWQGRRHNASRSQQWHAHTALETIPASTTETCSTADLKQCHVNSLSVLCELLTLMISQPIPSHDELGMYTTNLASLKYLLACCQRL